MKQINKLKVVLIEQNKTGKWLVEELSKNEVIIFRWCIMGISHHWKYLLK